MKELVVLETESPNGEAVDVLINPMYFGWAEDIPGTSYVRVFFITGGDARPSIKVRGTLGEVRRAITGDTLPH